MFKTLCQQLKANGAPQASQFGELPALHWHTYGSGHLHGLSAPGLNLEIDLEPDVLHRETRRRLTLAAGDQAPPLILERGYTNLGQLDHLTLRGAQNGGGQQYQYDALGRMSFRSVQSDQASSVIAYNYDAAGRLTGSQHDDQAHRYALDAAGNRLDGQQALTDNRLDHLDGARHRFDGAGNMIEKQAANGDRLTLGYDGANRLVQLTRASERGRTVDATYRYDGLGRRISKTVRHENGTTATTHYGWDGDRIVREASENQGSTIVYEPGSFVPMLRIDDTQEGPQLSAFVTDAIGTPMQLVAANGETQWQGQPDDWAAVKNVHGSARQPIRFQGQWQDEESGLYYNRHRYYDPQQGRYVSQDPIGLRGGTNLYGYVANPMGAVDPLGLSGGPYGLGSGPYSQSNYISRSVEQAESTGAAQPCSQSGSLWDKFLASMKSSPSPLNRSEEPLHNMRVDGLPESMHGEKIGLPEDNSFRENQELIYNTAIPSPIGTDAGIITGAIGYGGQALGRTGPIIRGNAATSAGLWSTTGMAYIHSHIFALFGPKGTIPASSSEEGGSE
ncbi:RHS repeat-associated core domain-containing protein [Vreelandella sp. GE22]